MHIEDSYSLGLMYLCDKEYIYIVFYKSYSQK